MVEIQTLLIAQGIDFGTANIIADILKMSDKNKLIGFLYKLLYKTNYQKYYQSFNTNYNFELYNIIYSDNFKKLFASTKITDRELENTKLFIRRSFIGEIKQLFSDLFLIHIYNLVVFALNTTRKETTILTPENVMISEDVESLGLDDFEKIRKNFTNFHYFRKKSVSTSLIMTGELLPTSINVVKSKSSLLPYRKFFMKIFPLDKQYTKKENGLFTELKMYNELFKLLKYNVTPNIISKVVSIELNNFQTDFLDHLDEFEREVINLHSIQSINKYYDIDENNKWNKVGLILTNPGGNTLHSVLKKLTPEQLKSIIFQLIYTLYVFEKLEISHGDIHLDNIFIIDVPERIISFYIDGQYYSVKTTKLVKIYDFDQSMIGKNTKFSIGGDNFIEVFKTENLTREAGRMLSDRFGETNIFNKNLDLCILFFYGFLRDMNMNPLIYSEYKLVLNKEYDKFIRDIFPGFYTYNFGSSGEKIKDTYQRISKNPVQLQELNKLMGLPEKKPFDSRINYGIQEDIYNNSWHRYYEFILRNELFYGRPIKSKIPTPFNNLYIPDTIIIPKLDMLKHQYFDKYRLAKGTSIDFKTNILYSIDERILS